MARILTARADDLSLEVEGFRPVRFPVTPAKDVLATIKEEPGLPNGAALCADLHSLFR